MTWFKVDDSFHSHPKVLAAEPAALGLWVVAGTWCSANLTDGFVPDYALPRLLPDSVRLADQLVACRLWKRTKGGYRFHDWADYNPTSESVKEERKAARDRMRAVRAKRKTYGETAGQGQDCSGEQQANVRENFARSSATPTRPDPTRSSSTEELPQKTSSSSGPRKRGTRIPDDFTATPDMIDWARQNTPNVGTRETDAFVDYYRAAPGQKGIKVDWVATWRNWMRRAQTDVDNRPGRTGAGRPSTGDQRVSDALNLAAEYAQQEQLLELSA